MSVLSSLGFASVRRRKQG
ncbi:hypothetical protein [Streptococcus sp. HN38]